MAIKNFAPQLTASVFKFRLELAEKRLSSYPLDTLDFIMMDLEHPAEAIRHAHQCTTDLTGRTIEFLARAHAVLPTPDETRMNELFHRMMLKGEYFGLSRRYFPYYQYTNDPVALGAIKSQLDRCVKVYKATPAAQMDEAMKPFVEFCSCCVEPLALMYEMTGDIDYIEAAKALAKVSLPDINSHSHGLMTTLRGMLTAARVSGDAWFLDQVKEYRDQILSFQYADGSISESFPRSHRNEGCSIADWIILNLRYAEVTGDASALDVAEHSILNAMFLNQFITGGFGHRNYSENGYTSTVEEAWWCCTQTCGLALCEFAEHAVQLIDGEIRINYPVPGVYTLKDKQHDIKLTLTSAYPADYDVFVKVEGDDDLPVTFRTPYYVKNATVKSLATVFGKSVTFHGDVGHYYELRDGGYVVKYGPLMLAPMIYNLGDAQWTPGNMVPEGYIRESIGKNYAIVCQTANENGFVDIAAGLDLPVWMVYDDGIGSRTGTGNRAAANVRMRAPNGEETILCFHPLCYSTSNLTLNNFPMMFAITD